MDPFGSIQLHLHHLLYCWEICSFVFFLFFFFSGFMKTFSCYQYSQVHHQRMEQHLDDGCYQRYVCLSAAQFKDSLSPLVFGSRKWKIKGENIFICSIQIWKIIVMLVMTIIQHEEPFLHLVFGLHQLITSSTRNFQSRVPDWLTQDENWPKYKYFNLPFLTCRTCTLPETYSRWQIAPWGFSLLNYIDLWFNLANFPTRIAFGVHAGYQRLHLSAIPTQSDLVHQSFKVQKNFSFKRVSASTFPLKMHDILRCGT